MFDKSKYWERRKKGLRGQYSVSEQPLSLRGNFHSSVDWPVKEVSKKAKLKNTKRARKAALHAAN